MSTPTRPAIAWCWRISSPAPMSRRRPWPGRAPAWACGSATASPPRWRRWARTPISASCSSAPLAVAAERGLTVATALETLNATDADAVFAAIRLANPGGLGQAEHHDVAHAAPAALHDAMAEAANRDRIARAYVTDFSDVPAIGLAALAEARAARPHMVYDRNPSRLSPGGSRQPCRPQARGGGGRTHPPGGRGPPRRDRPRRTAGRRAAGLRRVVEGAGHQSWHERRFYGRDAVLGRPRGCRRTAGLTRVHDPGIAAPDSWKFLRVRALRGL